MLIVDFFATSTMTVAGEVHLVNQSLSRFQASRLLIQSSGRFLGGGTLSGSIENDGIIQSGNTTSQDFGGQFADSHLIINGSITGSGQLLLAADERNGFRGVLELNGATSQTVKFVDPRGVLILDQPDGYTGTIQAQVGDAVYLAGLTTYGLDSLTYSGDAYGGTLTFKKSLGTSLNLHFSGAFDPSSFVLSNFGSSSAPELAVTIDASKPAGSSALLWHQSDGSVFKRYLNGANVAGTGYLGAFDPTQQFVATGDFNADQDTDFILRDGSGNLYLKGLSGNAVSGAGYVATVPSSYSLFANADFNGDGTTDLMWRDSGNGNVFLWDMTDNAVTGGGYVNTLGARTQVLSDGDFNGDGKHDLMLRDKDNGNLFLWQMNDTVVTQSTYVGTMAFSQWGLMASGDFNGDGKTDLIWRDKTNGNMFDWQMNGASVTSGNYIGTLAPGAVKVAATGDYNGDGKTDLVYEDTARNLTVDLRNGDSSIGGGYIGTQPANWTLWGHRP